jgi:hypothetical protein
MISALVLPTAMFLLVTTLLALSIRDERLPK